MMGVTLAKRRNTILHGMKGLAAFLCLSSVVRAAEPDWPQFRGPDLNPVGLNKALLDRWSRTENVEWVTNDSGARVVVTDRHGRQGLRHHRRDRGQVQAASDRHDIQQ